MESKSSYIKTDNNTFLNEQNIVWIEQMNECLKVATIQTGALCNTYKICKFNSPHSYNKLSDKIKHVENDTI